MKASDLSRLVTAKTERRPIALVTDLGPHARAKSHISAFTQLQNVELVALCDVDQSVLDGGIKSVESKTGKKPVGYTDLRKLLEDKSIDAISIATPNHQHTMQAIWAMQADKDVTKAVTDQGLSVQEYLGIMRLAENDATVRGKLMDRLK